MTIIVDERCEHVQAVAEMSAQLDHAHQVAAALVAERDALLLRLDDRSVLSDTDIDALRYADRLICNNPVAGCVDSVSRKHTSMVNAARAVISRILGGT